MNDENLPPTNSIASSSSSRQFNKPLIERRRRQRINNYLSELKTLLESLNEYESSYLSKLEKADILELTVRCVKNMRQQLPCTDQPLSTTEPCTAINSLDDSYSRGYESCMNEVMNCLQQVPHGGATRPSNRDVMAGLLTHLNKRRQHPYRTRTPMQKSFDATGRVSADVEPFTATLTRCASDVGSRTSAPEELLSGESNEKNLNTPPHITSSSLTNRPSPIRLPSDVIDVLQDSSLPPASKAPLNFDLANWNLPDSVEFKRTTRYDVRRPLNQGAILWSRQYACDDRQSCRQTKAELTSSVVGKNVVCADRFGESSEASNAVVGRKPYARPKLFDFPDDYDDVIRRPIWRPWYRL